MTRKRVVLWLASSMSFLRVRRPWISPASSEAMAASLRSPRGARGVCDHDRLEPERADHLPALVERVHVAAHGLDGLERGALRRQQLMVHPLEMFADDVEPGLRQQMMDIGDAAGDRVLHRQHREPRAALAHGGDGVLEARAGQCREARKHLAAGEVRVGAGLALE
jgi:hypothetical protein